MGCLVWTYVSRLVTLYPGHSLPATAEGHDDDRSQSYTTDMFEAIERRDLDELRALYHADYSYNRQ